MDSASPRPQRLEESRAMTSCSRLALLVLSAGVSLSASSASVQAPNTQTYPSRPLRFVVPFPPSGSNDIIARALVPRLTDDLGQTVIVDNRGGANGIIGTDLTAKSPPDGHTFLIVGNGFAINASIYRKLPFNPERDFAPAALLGYG